MNTAKDVQGFKGYLPSFERYAFSFAKYIFQRGWKALDYPTISYVSVNLP